MRGADFGMGGLVQLVIVLLIVAGVLALSFAAVLVCWMFGVEPRWWMAGAAGLFCLGFSAGWGPRSLCDG